MKEIQIITREIENYYDKPSGICQVNSQQREVVGVRQLAHYFARLLTRFSYIEIGRQIGGKDHATVIHSCRTVNNMYDTDRYFRADVIALKSRILTALKKGPWCQRVTMEITLHERQFKRGRWQCMIKGEPFTSTERTFTLKFSSIDEALKSYANEEVEKMTLTVVNQIEKSDDDCEYYPENEIAQCELA